MRGKVALKKLIRKRGANRVKRGYTPAWISFGPETNI